MRIVTVLTAVSDIVRRRMLKDPQRFGCWTCRRFQVEIVAGEPVMCYSLETAATGLSG
jgi:hypothetical protein